MVGKGLISLINLNKLSGSFFVVGICFWMIFKSKFSVGIDDFLHGSIFSDTKDFIIVFLFAREMSFEELFFLFSDNFILSEKLIEYFVGIFE